MRLCDLDIFLSFAEAMGNRQTDIRTGVVKQRLRADGSPVGEVLKNACRPDSRVDFPGDILGKPSDSPHFSHTKC